jgi:hypothetical protein
VVTIRPSIIESTLLREPFPGWIQGNRCSYISRVVPKLGLLLT